MLKIDKYISSFLLLWVTVVSISICIAIALAGVLGEFLHNLREVAPSASDDGDYEFFLSTLLLVGLFIGIGQWGVISDKIKITNGWILASLVGFSIGGFVSFQLLSFLPIFDFKYYMVYGAVQVIGAFTGAGMFMGFCQWVSLKRKIAGSLKWSLVNGLSFTVGLMPIALLPSYLIFIFIFVSIGLIALISGYFVELLIILPEAKIIT
ncbi:MAG: hypothetical protein HZB50_06830 [Chloroflexi bacterium]|nr:hypothetical protein [Chloroflexota bacterium]